jgi:uncharacterized phage protein gp47/JayE
MSFQPRNFEQVLSDMIAYMRANTTVTDYTVGSVIRTLLEACALEDDEQYYQMVQLLDAFRIATSTGSDLDERAADYNITRLKPAAASAEVVITNDNATTNTLKFDVTSGSPKTLYLVDATDFPTAPFDVRIGEGTPEVEDCSITAHNVSLNTLTASAVLNNHDIGAVVTKKGGGDKAVSSGVQTQVPAKGDSAALTFITTSKTTLADGNIYSSPIQAKASDTGSAGNVSAGQISQFKGSSPFTGAGVTNRKDASGGRDLETDDQLRNRLFKKMRELAKGTITAIESAVIGVTDSTTGQSIVTSKLREDLSNPFNNILYVDDGSGFTPSKTIMAQAVLSSPILIGVSSLPVSDVSNFPDSGYVLIDPTGATAEYVHYSSLGPGNVINLDAPTTALHAATQAVLLVEVLGIAEDGQRFFKIGNWPILDNSLSIFDNNAGVFTKKVENIDFFVNRANGDLQYAETDLLSGTVVLGHYSYYTGLLALAQKVICGDPNDRSNYPGVVAGGIIVHVSTPIVRRISVTLTITSKDGFDESQLRSDVQQAVESYIDSLLIGDNVYLAKIIEKTMEVKGVDNVIVSYPTSDVVILEDELPTSSDVYGNSLVTVL